MAPTGYQMTDAQEGKLNELIEAGLTKNVNFNLRSE
jgi:hypothetical protein